MKRLASNGSTARSSRGVGQARIDRRCGLHARVSAGPSAARSRRRPPRPCRCRRLRGPLRTVAQTPERVGPRGAVWRYRFRGGGIGVGVLRCAFGVHLRSMAARIATGRRPSDTSSSPRGRRRCRPGSRSRAAPTRRRCPSRRDGGRSTTRCRCARSTRSRRSTARTSGPRDGAPRTHRPPVLDRSAAPA